MSDKFDPIKEIYMMLYNVESEEEVKKLNIPNPYNPSHNLENNLTPNSIRGYIKSHFPSDFKDSNSDPVYLKPLYKDAPDNIKNTYNILKKLYSNDIITFDLPAISILPLEEVVLYFNKNNTFQEKDATDLLNINKIYETILDVNTYYHKNKLFDKMNKDFNHYLSKQFEPRYDSKKLRFMGIFNGYETQFQSIIRKNKVLSSYFFFDLDTTIREDNSLTDPIKLLFIDKTRHYMKEYKNIFAQKYKEKFNEDISGNTFNNLII